MSGESLLAERILGQRDVEDRAGRPRLSSSYADHLRRPLGRGEHGIQLGGIGDDHGRRCARAGRKRALDEPLPLDGLDLASEGVRGGQVRVAA